MKWINIEDMRDRLRDYYLDHMEDISDDGIGALYQVEIGLEKVEGSEDYIADLIDDMSTEDVAENYVNLQSKGNL